MRQPFSFDLFRFGGILFLLGNLDYDLCVRIETISCPFSSKQSPQY
jgi:hypothetical protein